MKIENCNALVTGGGGFIGSHLVEGLLREGCNVRAFVRYNSFNRWGWLDSFPRERLSRIDVLAGDIRDPGCVRKAMEGMDVVFHLAALIGIPFSYYAPDSYVDTNVKGTLNVLQSARELKTKRVILTSTSEVYGTAKYCPIDEKHPCQGQSPYSASKIGADRMGEAFYRSFDVPITMARPFNTYGPRQSARAIIPTVISQLLSGKDEIKLGSLHPKRDLVFVEDTVQGFIEMAKADGTVGEEINISTQSEVSIKDLVDMIVRLANSSAKIIREEERVRPERSEVDRLLGCNEKLRALTSWRQKYTLEKGLEATIDWFRNKDNLSMYKAEIYNV